MIKCPYCGADPEKFETQLKAYVPVSISNDGTVTLNASDGKLPTAKAVGFQRSYG